MVCIVFVRFLHFYGVLFFFFPKKSSGNTGWKTGKPVSIVFGVRQQRLGKNTLTKLEVAELFLPWTVVQSSNKCTMCSSGQRDCLNGHISVHTDHKWAGGMFYSEH